MVLTDAQILAQIPAARARTEQLRRTGLRATRVRHSVARRALVLTLGNGTEVAIPIRRIAALRWATPRDLADVHVSPTGGAVRWERLDVDLSVPGLLEIAFERSGVQALFAAAGGRATSARKAEASRANGAKGGRPRKR